MIVIYIISGWIVTFVIAVIMGYLSWTGVEQELGKPITPIKDFLLQVWGWIKEDLGLA